MVDLIGEKIRALRTEKNFTQQELANKIEVSKNSVSLYETGKKYPSLVTLCRIATVFNVSTDYLLGLSNARETEFTDLDDIQLDILRKTIHQFEQLNKLKSNDKRRT